MSGQTVPMRLLFDAKSQWRVVQGNGDNTHVGGAFFCWDFAAISGSSGGLPIFAAAAGEVVDVHLERGWYYVKHAEGELFAYVHCLPQSVLVHVGQRIMQGQWMSSIGDQGTSLGNFHLHVAMSNLVGKIPEEGGDPDHLVHTIPSKFSDYEVLDEVTQR